MTESLVFFPFPTLVDQIDSLCAQRKSGNLVLISDDNRMAQMHLLQGLIMMIVCRGRRGQDALPLMRTIANARMTLDSNALVKNEGTAFSPASVLAYLKGATQQLPEPRNVDAVLGGIVADTVQAAPGAVRTQSAEAPKNSVTPDIRRFLQTVMVRYIGPMAEIVCEEHFDAVQDLRALVGALAAEIPNPNQSSAFKAEIAKSLGIAGL